MIYTYGPQTVYLPSGWKKLLVARFKRTEMTKNHACVKTNFFAAFKKNQIYAVIARWKIF